MRRWPRSMKTTKAVTRITTAITKIADRGEMAPVLTSWKSPLAAFGSPATIPAKMMIEIPLPRPRSVICSPSHIRNIVPVTRLTAQVKRNIRPGIRTRPAWLSRATAMPIAWKNPKSNVP